MTSDEEENAVRILAREIGLARLIEIAKRLLEKEKSGQ